MNIKQLFAYTLECAQQLRPNYCRWRSFVTTRPTIESLAVVVVL